VPEPVLSIRDLVVEFRTEDGVVHAVDGISYDVFPGETLGIVGESGSGKSVSTLSILGLIPQPPGRVVSGTAVFNGRDLLKLKKKELRDFRGNEVAMVFQDPMTSLNPVLRIGEQLGEAITTHYPKEPDAKVKERVIELLRLVGVPNPDVRYTQYPHEFSGGMRQRAMIAMADREFAFSPDPRRADDRTRRHDPGSGARGLEDGAGRDARSHDPDHARSRHRGGAVREGDRDVCRQDRRVRRRAHDLPEPASSLHDRSHGLAAEADGGRGMAASDPRTAALADQPAARLRVSSALLPVGGAVAPAARRCRSCERRTAAKTTCLHVISPTS